MEKQLRLGKEVKLHKPYSYGAYNKILKDKQIIRITEGCPHDCPYCYEPTEIKIFGVPKIERNFVQIIDMNLICKKEALDIIKSLPEKLNGHVIKYELVCGIDYRFLTQEIANELKKKNFIRPRIAWDWGFEQQYKIKDAIEILVKAGYRRNEIMVFMICNWRIPYEENCRKLDLCKVWNVKVCDCYFDGQIAPNIQPIYWTSEQIKDFRKKVRKHNQLVNFGIDPELK
jgi:hypothetical protein